MAKVPLYLVSSAVSAIFETDLILKVTVLQVLHVSPLKFIQSVFAPWPGLYSWPSNFSPLIWSVYLFHSVLVNYVKRSGVILSVRIGAFSCILFGEPGVTVL